MQYFLFIFKSALDDFQRNKVRTILTSLGILIGVSSVVILMALGLGLKQFIKNQFESLGTNQVIIMPGKLLSESGGFSRGGGFGGVRFEEKDIISLRKIKEASFVVPEFIKTVTLTGDKDSAIGTLDATTADIFPVSNFEAEFGTVFLKTDVEKRSKVAVLGPKIAGKIFGSTEDAVGKTVKTQSQSFKVIGVLKSKGGGGFGGPDLDSYFYVPYKAAFVFNPDKKFYSVTIKTETEEMIPAVKEEAKRILLKDYKKDEFSVIEMKEILNAVTAIFAVLNSILVAIAAISLLVGGIGIMNIMYVSVMERVREIGIRRVLGATGKDILHQFLTEAILLSIMGGILGLLFSFISILFIQQFFPAYIDFTAVIIALGV